MHEIITVSFSQRAGHLLTQFYNGQESLFGYNNPGKPEIPVNHEIFFNKTISSDRRYVNYTPRTLIWDLKGGFGALGIHEYEYDRKIEISQSTWDRPPEIQKQNPIRKAEYQAALDEGKHAEFDPTTVKYWTDYSRVLHSPISLQQISSWTYKPQDFPHTQRPGDDPNQQHSQQFDSFTLGESAWEEEYSSSAAALDHLDETLRVQIERCENLSGLNLITEIDSGWSGFSSKFLTFALDDFIVKKPVVTWGLMDSSATSKLNGRRALSRVQSTVSLASQSSLFVPLRVPGNALKGPESLWSAGCLLNRPYTEFCMSLVDQKGGIQLYDVVQSLKRGSKRNIVAEVKSLSARDGDLKVADYSFNCKDLSRGSGRKPGRTAASYTVVQPTKYTKYLKDIDLEEKACDIVGLKEKEAGGTRKEDMTVKKLRIEFPEAETVTQEYRVSGDDFLVSHYEVNSSTRQDLKNLKKLVPRLVRGEERASLVDELETMADDYVHGWDGDMFGSSDEDDYE